MFEIGAYVITSFGNFGPNVLEDIGQIEDVDGGTLVIRTARKIDMLRRVDATDCVLGSIEDWHRGLTKRGVDRLAQCQNGRKNRYRTTIQGAPRGGTLAHYDNGDIVSVFMRGKSEPIKILVALCDFAGIETLGEGRKTHPSTYECCVLRWGHLSPGPLRMTVGNVMRGVVRRHMNKLDLSKEEMASALLNVNVV